MGGEGTLKYDKFQVLFLANHHSNANEVQIVGGMILYSGSGLGFKTKFRRILFFTVQ